MSHCLSFGSNCEMGMMINRYYNNNLYSNLFNWTNITLENICIILDNIDCLYDTNNIIIIYRIFDNESNIYSSSKIEDIKQ
jgi:hypothetical protein